MHNVLRECYRTVADAKSMMTSRIEKISGVRVARSLVLYVCFVDRCLSFCTFSVGHCVIYGF